MPPTPTRRDALRLTAAAALAAAFAAPARAAFAPAPFDRAAFDAAMAAGKPILVEVSAPWCPVCTQQKKIMAELFADPRFGGIAQFEVDFDSRKDVLRAFGVQKQSTLIVFAGGREVGRSVGDTDPARIAALIGGAVGGV
jgi:thioredoxin-like negative regulator of GroEL